MREKKMEEERRIIMSRVCGGKQSVAERASAHRIRVRDLAMIAYSLLCVGVRVSHTANEMRSQRNIADCNSHWDHRFFGMYDGRSRIRHHT